MKYTIVIEKAPNNYSALSPDIPCCVSTGATPEEMRLLMREAIEFHFDCLEIDGDPIPAPSSWIETVEATAGRKYIIVYEKELDNYAAYVLDFMPRSEVTGRNVEEVQQNMRRAFAGCLAVKELNGEPLPEPSSWAETMEIAYPNRVSA